MLYRRERRALRRAWDTYAFPVLGVGITVALAAAIILSAIADGSAKARCEDAGGAVTEYETGEMTCHTIGHVASCRPVYKWRCER